MPRPRPRAQERLEADLKGLEFVANRLKDGTLDGFVGELLVETHTLIVRMGRTCHHYVQPGVEFFWAAYPYVDSR